MVSKSVDSQNEALLGSKYQTGTVFHLGFQMVYVIVWGVFNVYLISERIESYAKSGRDF